MPCKLFRFGKRDPTEAPIPSFDRARRYQTPRTSAAASAWAENEIFGSPRTSEDVRRAYLASHPPTPNSSANQSRANSDDEDDKKR